MFRMKRMLAVAAALLWFAAAASAQDSTVTSISQLRTGDRIRVEFNRGDLRVTSAGQFMILANDSITIQLDNMQETMPLSAIDRIQVVGGRQSRGRYALIGGVIGFAAGVGASVVDRELIYKDGVVRREVTVCDPTCRPAWELRDAGPYTRRPAVVASGVALGAVIGALLPGTRWRNIEVRPRTASTGSTELVAGVSLR